MANKVTASEPKVGGAVYNAPVSTTLPTSAGAALQSGFVSLGYVSEDGVRNTNTPESEDIKAWGGDVVLSLQKSKTDKFKFMLIESMDANVLKAVYGDSNVTVDDKGNISVTANNKALDAKAWVVDMILKGNVPKRIVIPSGIVTEVSEITYKSDQVVGYEVTITATADAAGNTHYEYIGNQA